MLAFPLAAPLLAMAFASMGTGDVSKYYTSRGMRNTCNLEFAFLLLIESLREPYNLAQAEVLPMQQW
jgi:hypothetical protein